MVDTEAGVGAAQHKAGPVHTIVVLWERAQPRGRCIGLMRSLYMGFGSGGAVQVWDLERLDHRPCDQTRDGTTERGLVRVGLCICLVYSSLFYEERDW